MCSQFSERSRPSRFSASPATRSVHVRASVCVSVQLESCECACACVCRAERIRPRWLPVARFRSASSPFFGRFFIWCLATYMSSRRRRLPDARTPRHDRWWSSSAAALAGCTDTLVRPITGPSSPPAPPETRATSSPVPYPWPWSCPCRPSATLRSPPPRRSRCPTRRRRRDEGIYTAYTSPNGGCKKCVGIASSCPNEPRSYAG